MSGPELIVAALKRAGITTVCTLPDLKLLELINLVDRDPNLRHVPLCREEEGVGICAGSYLTGGKPALIMQNGGFLNACNALTTTALHLQVPMLLLIYLAGDFGDRGFATLGNVTESALEALRIRYQVLREHQDIDRVIGGAWVLAEDAQLPVAVLLTKSVLLEAA